MFSSTASIDVTNLLYLKSLSNFDNVSVPKSSISWVTNDLISDTDFNDVTVLSWTVDITWM